MLFKHKNCGEGNVQTHKRVAGTNISIEGFYSLIFNVKSEFFYCVIFDINLVAKQPPRK